MLATILTSLLWWVLGFSAADAVPVSLMGSAGSMERQHRIAVENGYEFLRRPADVDRAVDGGELVPLIPNEVLALKYPQESVARPELKHFLESFAETLRAGCGEPLVITSLTRPLLKQPRNAHRLSVHPAGIAVDLRVPRTSRCRRWLEDSLLGLEAKGVLDVTRERSPAHYHVALFPQEYLAHLGLDAARRAEIVVNPISPPVPSAPIRGPAFR